MLEEKPQTYANHARIDPLYHYFVAPVAVLNLVVQLSALVRHFSNSQLLITAVSLAFVLAVYRIRTVGLTVQDRVIRLEETLRLERLLPSDRRADIAGLRRGQFVALRFASDQELPALFDQTLANQWNGKQIKQAIKNWRADSFRV